MSRPSGKRPPAGMIRASWHRAAAMVVLVFLGACSGSQSALDPAGEAAEKLARLFWLMAAGAVVVWLGVAGLALHAWRAPRPADAQEEARRSRFFIVVCGAVIPTVVLVALLVHGLAMLPRLLEPAPPGSLRVKVVGHQWWWDVSYQAPDGRTVRTANEVHLPVGESVEFLLESADVIHSFWIPPLGGKMDMIPGRRTRLTLRPTRTGLFRGVCAEYCGTSHALMAFHVVVSPRETFDRWLEQQGRPVEPPANTPAARGLDIFLRSGCGACHALRGTEADGAIGPDLTHVGGRTSLGAGILPNDVAAFRRWLAETHRVKPGVLMPHFGMLPDEELDALAGYLDSLQ